MLEVILIVIVILWLVGGPAYYGPRYGTNYGYAPWYGGGLGVIVVLLVVLWALGILGGGHAVVIR